MRKRQSCFTPGLESVVACSIGTVPDQVRPSLPLLAQRIGERLSIGRDSGRLAAISAPAGCLLAGLGEKVEEVLSANPERDVVSTAGS